MEAGVTSIINAVHGEYVASDVSSGSSDAEGVIWSLGVCGFVVMMLFFPYFAAFLGRTKSWWLGGVIGILTGVFASAVLLFSGIFTDLGGAQYAALPCCPLVFGIIGLALDFILSRTYKIRKAKGLSTGWLNSTGGFSSRSSGFSSFSSGSSGGFSSGGGSFGGGGASSGW